MAFSDGPDELNPDSLPPFHPVDSVLDLADRGDESQADTAGDEDGAGDDEQKAPSQNREAGNVVNLFGRRALKRIQDLLRGHFVTRPPNE